MDGPVVTLGGGGSAGERKAAGPELPHYGNILSPKSAPTFNQLSLLTTDKSTDNEVSSAKIVDYLEDIYSIARNCLDDIAEKSKNEQHDNNRELEIRHAKLINTKIVPCSNVTLQVTEFNRSDVTPEEKQRVKWRIERQHVNNNISDFQNVILQSDETASCTFKACYRNEYDMQYVAYPYLDGKIDDVSVKFTIESMESIRKKIISSLGIIERKLYCTKEDINLEEDCDYRCIVIHHAGDRYCESDHPSKLYKQNLGGIPYHYIVDYQGKIYEGRSIKYKGSHVKGANTRRIGICFLGDYAPYNEAELFDFKDDSLPNDKNMNATRMLITTLMLHFNITHLCGHKEIAKLHSNPTVCPGANLMPFVEELRQEFSLAIPDETNKDLRDDDECY